MAEDHNNSYYNLGTGSDVDENYTCVLSALISSTFFQQALLLE